jgi:peroxiredoxin
METEKPALSTWIPAILILALCVINLFLVKQNLSFRKLLAAAGRSNLTANSLKVGDVVPALSGTDIDGRAFALDYKKDGRHRLLMFFSPDCPYCVKQAPLWREVLDTLDSSRFRVVGVVGDRLDKSEVAKHIEMVGYDKTKTPLQIVFLSNESLMRYKLTATPTTLLISDDGRVEHAWVGKWDNAKTLEVAEALK